MKKIMIGIGGILLLLTSSTTNAYANIVFPAIANQFVVIFVVGPYASVLMALLILFAEASFLKKLNIRPAFFWSFIINLVSSVVGILISIFAFHGTNIFTYGNMRFGTYLGLAPGYILTVLFEGLLLLICVSILRLDKKASDCFKTSMLMNFFSYLILLMGIVIADFISKGEIFSH